MYWKVNVFITYLLSHEHEDACVVILEGKRGYVQDQFSQSSETLQ